jgi:hypothetical protein
MIPALLPLLLGATLWSDPSGRVRCNVPDEYHPAGEGRFALGDERLILTPFVPAASVPPAELPARLLAAVGLPVPAPGSSASSSLTLAGAVMTVRSSDGSAGVALLGLPADTLLAAHAATVARACEVVPPVAPAAPPAPPRPVVAGNQIFDSGFHVALPVPPSAQPFEYKGSGAVRGPGWQAFLVAPDAPAASPEDRTLTLLAEVGATASAPPVAASLGAFGGAVAVGPFARDGRQFLAEAVVIDASGAFVGVVLIADAASQRPAQEAFQWMLNSATPPSP